VHNYLDMEIPPPKHVVGTNPLGRTYCRSIEN